MKSLPTSRVFRAVLVAAAGLAVAGAVLAQSGSVLSAVPGQRTPMALPPADKDGVHLTLSQAIGIALANNQDLNVTINAAEATQFQLMSAKGIFDPLLQGAAHRAHQETPASSELSGAPISVKQDTYDYSAGVSQLAPWGGTFSAGTTGGRLSTNSTFYNVNPSFNTGLQLSMSQPLLRNFGITATKWQIWIARNQRDQAYQQVVRSVQTGLDAVEQAYWDLAYAYENLKVKLEAKAIAVELNRITKIKIDVGSLAPIDIVQTEVNIATADQDIINAEGAIGLAQDQLKRQLTSDPAAWGSTPIIPTDSVRVEQGTFNLDSGMSTALAKRPEIIQAAYAVDSQKIRLDYWTNQVLPGVNLVGNYGTVGLGGTFFVSPCNSLNPPPSCNSTNPPPPVVVADNGLGSAYHQSVNRLFPNWSIGLTVSYPILNRAAEGQRGAARYQLDSDKALQTTTELNVIVEVRNAHRAIETAEKQIVAAAKGRELAERNLDAARKKYENGMTTGFEVSQLQTNLSDARSRELNALVIYRKAVSAYHDAIADNLEWKSIAIQGMPDMAPPTPVDTNAVLMRAAAQPGAPAAP
ncbi:MAG TPA: TolC family protein [Thermoanaerobaculia bacterium]|nr:TolC family protein [Thermoanaerobaculia bacterium]